MLLTKTLFREIIDYQQIVGKNQNSPSGAERKQMTEITVGSQFTTAKSGVTGVVQEIIKNANGTSRVRLDVAGQERWTTVK